MTPMLSPTVQLSDGRTLTYAEYGSLGGRPLLYFHGHPGSRLEAAFLADACAASGVRLIGIDRPGLGLSTWLAGRTALDWPRDVAQLAGALRLDTFAVVGFSGGAPYALACARELGPRVTACGLVSGVGRTSPFVSFLARWVPWVMLPAMKKRFSSPERAAATLAGVTGRWIEADRQAFAAPGVADLMARALAESFRQGTRGAALDGSIIGARDWGFDPATVRHGSLHLWHGEADDRVPVAQARELAGRLPTCQATYFPGEGHISTIVNHASEIVRALFP